MASYLIVTTFKINFVLAVCAPGCVHGQCTIPDICECELGWTGDDCNTGNGIF